MSVNMSLNKLRETVKDRKSGLLPSMGLHSWTSLRDLTTDHSDIFFCELPFAFLLFLPFHKTLFYFSYIKRETKKGPELLKTTNVSL